MDVCFGIVEFICFLILVRFLTEKKEEEVLVIFFISG